MAEEKKRYIWKLNSRKGSLMFNCANPEPG
jgi:hypothetical protein